MAVFKQQDIVKQLTAEIKSGKLVAPGEYFPTIRSLSESFDVSPVTIQRAVHQLRKSGLLERKGRRLKIIRSSCGTLRRIGVVVHQLDNPFYSRLLNELEKEGEKRGMEIFSSGASDAGKIKRMIKMFEENGVDGICLCCMANENTVPEKNTPAVCIGHDNGVLPCIEVDNLRAGEMAAEHLIRQGCRDFFYISNAGLIKDNRKSGFISCLENSGFHLPPEHTFSISTEFQNDELVKWLKNIKFTRPAGVFCYHDLWSMRILRAAHFLSLRVPEDIAIIGMDNLPICAETLPPLSSIAYPLKKLASGALDMLEEIHRNRKIQNRSIIFLEPQLTVRQSSLILR